MAFSAKMICDSISPDRVRLSTMEVTFPRFVLAEFNTHRMFSRNSASSRAIPVEKTLKRIESDPYIPIHWGQNQKGMQAEHEVSEDKKHHAEYLWLAAKESAMDSADRLLRCGIHKQIVNRILEPFQWHTVIVTATEWSNFFALRSHPNAQPEIRKISNIIQKMMATNTPRVLSYGDWHTPFLSLDERNEYIKTMELTVGPNDNYFEYFPKWIDYLKKVSAGRCARVSYLTHDGKRDLQADVDLCTRLQTSGHMSPLEHVARPMTKEDAEIIVMNHLNSAGGLPDVNVSATFSGNFRGWFQFRKEFRHENNFAEVTK